jgi:HAD superfamily 5'-nucleotidase-like hydrolase
MKQTFPVTPPGRGIYCNRTLNLRSIRAIGFDMDYTLVHYKVEEWERRAYEHLRQRLVTLKWPVEGLAFDPQLCARGLVIDAERGNVVKANRFGYVMRAYHGTQPLEHDAWRKAYARERVDLSDPRWAFLNTLFNISEGCMYMQLVDLLDQRKLPDVLGYADLYRVVRRSLDEAHMEGQLKAEIVGAPERFIELDEELPLALLDLKHAGKKLLLITNSEWEYTAPVMSYALDRFLAAGTTWRALFDLVIVSARKPDFFTARIPIHQVVTDSGLLRPFPAKLEEGSVYHGGNARTVEKHLECSGDDILYVGDHIFTDVNVSKSVLRWRTALVLRELEEEQGALGRFRDDQAHLNELMAQKEELEYQSCQARVQVQRAKERYGPAPSAKVSELDRRMGDLRRQLQDLDVAIGPLAKASGELVNPHWGPPMRAGSDKSHLARQVERYADIYMSRVSNFLFQTPFVYLRSPRGSLPHDPLS